MMNDDRRLVPSNERSTDEIYSMKRRRSLFTVVFLVVYAFSLSEIDGERTLMSAAWKEILGEFHPDSPKNAERLTEAEVVPKWQAFLHADDITKQLNWFQTYCSDKFGMDDHLEWFWICDIDQVRASWDTETPPLEKHMNCSPSFVHNHILHGDDPRCVPHGEESLDLLGRLSRTEGGTAKIEKINSVYDEYTTRAGSPLFESVDERMDTVDQQLAEIKDLLGGLTREQRTRLELGVAQRQRKLRLSSDVNNASDVSRRKRLLGDHERRLADPKCFPLDSGCPLPGFEDVERPEAECGCFRANGHVLSTCRNHHWGMIHMCRPVHLDVRFSIFRVVTGTGAGVTKYGRTYANETRTMWFTVKMTFDAVQGTVAEPAGWFSARLGIEEWEFYGYKPVITSISGFVTVSVLVLVVGNLMLSLLHLPKNLRSFLDLRSPEVVLEAVRELRGDAENTSPPTIREMRRVTEGRINVILDPRGTRPYATTTALVVDTSISLIVLLAMITSAFQFHSKTIPALGAIEKQTALHYILHELNWRNMFTELFYEFFLDNVALHGVAWFLIYLRQAIVIMDQYAGLRWLPTTIELAMVRSLYFLLAFTTLILGCSVVMWLLFGSRFIQFSSFSRAYFELFLLACGAQGTIFDDVFPFEDNTSLMVTAYLAIYLILVVMIGFNFLLTILLDAYNVALDPVQAHEVMEQSRDFIVGNLMTTLGIRAEGVKPVTIELRNSPTFLRGSFTREPMT